MTLFTYRFVLFVLPVYLEFDSENYRDIIHISCEHTHLFSNFFETYKFKFLDVVAWYHLTCGIM
jgi:hypothetical protein